MILLDANYVLRYLLDDNHTMFLEAKKIIENESCLILNEVIAEVVYVLNGHYEVSKEIISDTISQFIALPTLLMYEDKAFLIEALKRFKNSNLDFVDCYLCSLSKKYAIKSFDKGVNKCLQN